MLKLNKSKIFQIIEWVNKSSDGSANVQQKCEAITQIQEVLLHSDSDLLDEFIDNILSFSHDASQDVRRGVVGFIEEIRYVLADRRDVQDGAKIDEFYQKTRGFLLVQIVCSESAFFCRLLLVEGV